MSDFNITAKNDYIITKAVVDGEDKPFETVDNSQRNQYLEAVAVGEEVTSCKVGDKLIPYGSEFQAFNYQDQQYIVLTDNQVLGVVNV